MLLRAAVVVVVVLAVFVVVLLLLLLSAHEKLLLVYQDACKLCTQEFASSKLANIFTCMLSTCFSNSRCYTDAQ